MMHQQHPARARPWPGLTAELEGATYGQLTVEAPSGVDADGYVRVACRCECGRVAVRRVVDLTAGRAVACRVCLPPPRPLPPSKRVPLRIRDPEAWERTKARYRDRRRERRRRDPSYREREAEYARRYRQRQRERRAGR